MVPLFQDFASRQIIRHNSRQRSGWFWIHSGFLCRRIHPLKKIPKEEKQGKCRTQSRLHPKCLYSWRGPIRTLNQPMASRYWCHRVVACKSTGWKHTEFPFKPHNGRSIHLLQQQFTSATPVLIYNKPACSATQWFWIPSSTIWIWTIITGFRSTFFPIRTTIQNLCFFLIIYAIVVQFLEHGCMSISRFDDSNLCWRSTPHWVGYFC